MIPFNAFVYTKGVVKCCFKKSFKNRLPPFSNSKLGPEIHHISVSTVYTSLIFVVC